MQLRFLATGAAVLALALSSCGFDYATERDYTVAGGANDRDGDVDVLSAVVVSAEEGSGTFIASLSNNDTDTEQTFTAISGDDGASITADFDPVTIAPGGLVNLADPAADIVVTGDFAAGDFLPLAIDFGNGDRVMMQVPVVRDDFGYWEGMDASTGTSTGTSTDSSTDAEGDAS